ncbi:MAG: 50S ribosomal protein L25/general stress protein Ctc [Candidatus Eiseniibacteriota bacterium]
MADFATLAAEPRDRAGKGAARAARRAGRVPAVIYGDKQAPVMVTIDPKVLVQELSKPGFFTRQFNIELAGKQHHVLPRDVQFDPVLDRPLHADFLRVTERTQVHVEIPVKFINEAESPGIKRGGVLNIVRHEIEVICAVGNIPPGFTVDLTGLDIGDSVHISSIKMPEGVRPAIADRDFTVASVAAPTVVRDEAQEAAAAAAAAAGVTPTEGEAAAEGAAPAEGAGAGAGAAPGSAPKAAAPAKAPAPAKK